jgi:hypothetical protein
MLYCIHDTTTGLVVMYGRGCFVVASRTGFQSALKVFIYDIIMYGRGCPMGVF